MTAKSLPIHSAIIAALAAVFVSSAPVHAQFVRPVALKQTAPKPGDFSGGADSMGARSITSAGGTGRRVLRVVGGAVLGGAIGGGAGYVVAAVRCGRRPGCSPTASYPYLRFGAVAGAVVGGGIAHGTSGVVPNRRRALARAAGQLASNTLTWVAAAEGRRTVTVGGTISLPYSPRGGRATP